MPGKIIGKVDTPGWGSYNHKQSFTEKAMKDKSKQYAFPREPGQLKTGKVCC